MLGVEARPTLSTLPVPASDLLSSGDYAWVGRRAVLLDHALWQGTS